MKHIPKIIIICLTVLVITAIILVSNRIRGNLLQVDYLNVGQGDAIFITTPSRFQILVDGGPDDSVLEELRQVMPIGDRSIDWLILTHSDADHITGLIDVVQNYRISHVIMQDFENDTGLYYGWMDILSEKEIPTTRLSSPQQMIIEDSILLSFYHPTQDALDSGMDVNNASVVFEMEYGEISFMFTGDIEIEAEEMLVEKFRDNLKSTVLKVAHHGSKTSSTIDFVESVDPELAIIQVGQDNSFNHPNGRVLHRLEQRGIKYWRNDIDGAIRLVADGQSIWLQNGGFGFFSQLFGQNKEKVYNVANN